MRGRKKKGRKMAKLSPVQNNIIQKNLTTSFASISKTISDSRLIPLDHVTVVLNVVNRFIFQNCVVHLNWILFFLIFGLYSYYDPQQNLFTGKIIENRALLLWYGLYDDLVNIFGFWIWIEVWTSTHLYQHTLMELWHIREDRQAARRHILRWHPLNR